MPSVFYNIEFKVKKLLTDTEKYYIRQKEIKLKQKTKLFQCNFFHAFSIQTLPLNGIMLMTYGKKEK